MQARQLCPPKRLGTGSSSISQHAPHRYPQVHKLSKPLATRGCRSRSGLFALQSSSRGRLMRPAQASFRLAQPWRLFLPLAPAVGAARVGKQHTTNMLWTRYQCSRDFGYRRVVLVHSLLREWGRVGQAHHRAFAPNARGGEWSLHPCGCRLRHRVRRSVLRAIPVAHIAGQPPWTTDVGHHTIARQQFASRHPAAAGASVAHSFARRRGMQRISLWT